MQFIIVAIIPIPSAFVLSILLLVRPLQKFPPPITIATWTPLSTIVLTCFATATQVSSSKPVFYHLLRLPRLTLIKLCSSLSPLSYMHAKFVIILIVLFISAKSKDRITYIIKKIKENNLLYLSKFAFIFCFYSSSKYPKLSLISLPLTNNFIL